MGFVKFEKCFFKSYGQYQHLINVGNPSELLVESPYVGEAPGGGGPSQQADKEETEQHC